MPEILPSSKPKAPKHATLHRGANWNPIFCANCGADGGYVPDNQQFAFYLCNPCAEKWAPLTNMALIPDEVFWKKVKDAQIEKYGRELSPQEIAIELDNPSSMLSKLKKDGK